MLQLIRRSARQPTSAVEGAEPVIASASGGLRRTDWLLGGSIATLAVVFVAGLLGLRSSTAELQDQSRGNTRDITALKADTVDRINGIAGDLAKTNQTLTDLIALRAQEKPSVAAPLGGEPSSRAAVAKAAASRDVKKAAKATAPTPVARPTLPPPEPLTVRRKPARERAEEARRRQTKPGKAAIAQKPEPKPPAELARLRREAANRLLRLRRLARRANG